MMALKVESALKACVCSSGKKAMPVACCSTSYNTSSLVCIKGITATSISVRVEQLKTKQKKCSEMSTKSNKKSVQNCHNPDSKNIYTEQTRARPMSKYGTNMKKTDPDQYHFAQWARCDVG